MGQTIYYKGKRLERIEGCYLGRLKEVKEPISEDKGRYIPIKDLKNKKSGKTTVSSQEQFQ